MSTLASYRILRQRVVIPPSGAWYGELWLDSTVLPPRVPSVLQIGDLALVGTPIRPLLEDDPAGGLVGVVVIGGFGNWKNPVIRAGRYASEGSHASGGVRLLTVLRDLAGPRMANEPYDEPPDVSLGTMYGWEASTPIAPVTYQTVLADLVWRGYIPTWRVAETGRTRFDAWPSLGPADGRGRVMSRSASRNRRTVGLDNFVRAFLPGATLEGSPILKLTLTENADALTVEVE